MQASNPQSPGIHAPWASERSAVVAALKHAAAATGSDFHYLLGTAMRESSLKPGAKSAHSSATGLFQFIEQTWLGLVKTHGAQYGLASYADAINRGADGRYHCDPGLRASVLALRKDPQTSALMAGEMAKDTQKQLSGELGRDVCGGELYAAHFLGPEAACRLIRLNEQDPSASAAAQFPQAAGSNRSVFFHHDGSPKSVRDVYNWAMRQPGADGAVRVAQLPDITPPVTAQHARTVVAGAHDAEVQMLMMSVLNWQPQSSVMSGVMSGGMADGLGGNMGGGFASNFSALTMLGASGRTGASPLSFGPGLLSILSDARTNSRNSQS
ncbi:MAG: lytic transglycosylase domain-containing protein [Alphaproteobacteria bacterium]|nr:lytic transglycosylase domain-containing protein [Alphaproteobacteria bacterium]